MGSNTEFTEFHKKWFSIAAPINAKKATATLTFVGVPIVTQIVTIGSEIYEFVAQAGDIADSANVPVVLGSTLTADNAVTQLALAMNSFSALATAVASTANDTVVASYVVVGTEGNDVEVGEDCTNASWGAQVTNLSGGQYATPAKTAGFIILSNVWYIATKPTSKFTTDSWKNMTPTLVEGDGSE